MSTLDQRSDVTSEDLIREGVIDFKMVTFTLAGKDYGIDIIAVKEISQGTTFTYVPNTAPYVLGVHNLRGDIIPIIDLRRMFRLPRDGDQESDTSLILRLDDLLVGVIVDRVDRVVGVSTHDIQPAPSFFADVNVKYISGVVESEDKLYIILNVTRISGEERLLDLGLATDGVEELHSEETERDEVAEVGQAAADQADAEVAFGFVMEGLVTLRHFHVTKLNSEWARERFKVWHQERAGQGEALQLRGVDDADHYLDNYFSRQTGRLWEAELTDALRRALPDGTGPFHALSAGCGGGWETYSLAAVLRIRYPQRRIVVWGQDKDLLAVSNAPHLTVERAEAPELFVQFLSGDAAPARFDRSLRDLINFEYHDITNTGDLPGAWT